MAKKTQADKMFAKSIQDYQDEQTKAAYKRTDLFGKHRELMDLWARFATEKSGEIITLRANKNWHMNRV